jgi:1,2-diacylglycerol 3-alpha-glucosyltransferase
MDKVKHILFLVPGFPKDENDFNCIPPLQEFLIEFVSQHPSIKISVIAFQYPYIKDSYFWNGINVVPLVGRNSTSKKATVWLKAIYSAIKINKTSPIDVIHSLWIGECAMIGKLLSKKFGCQHICTLMGQDVKSSNKYLRWLKNLDAKFIALSKNQADLFLKLTNKNVAEIIHWGIDDQMIKSQERDIDLLGVGSLIPLKNYSLFINAVEVVVSYFPNLKCVLVGSGPELNKLKMMSEKKRLSNNIRFTGLLDRQDIFNLMQKSKILIHPSKFEGFGFVFAEALANGMNIVSFDVGIAQENQKWTIAKDEKDFISITKKLLREKLSYNPINLFPLQETVDRYFALYNS